MESWAPTIFLIAPLSTYMLRLKFVMGELKLYVHGIIRKYSGILSQIRQISNFVSIKLWVIFVI